MKISIHPTGSAAAWLAGVLALAVLAPVPAVAQVPEPADPAAPSGVFVEELTVEVINVDVVVTDRSGRPVAGLGRDDFELELDGQPVPITNFYAESGAAALAERPSVDLEERREPSFRSLEEVAADAPRRTHVVVLVDHTRLRANNRKRAFAALKEAVRSLEDDALVAVVGIEGSLVFYSDFLFDRQGVEKVLDEATRVSAANDVAEFERRQIFGELARGMSGGILARTTLANDQVLISRIRAYAAEEYARGIRTLRQIESVISTLAGVSGRKLLLYVGEGVPTRPGEGMYVEFRNRFSGPERGLPHQDFNTDYTREIGRFDLTEPMRQLADAANRAGVTLYAIDAEPSHGGEIRSALTEQGATSEAITAVDENYREPLEYASKATGGRLLQSSGTLGEQLVELTRGFSTFYSLGFAPPAGWQPGSERELEIRVRGRKGLEVNHREKVWLPRADDREASATVAALMYHTLDNPLGVRATPGLAAPREDGNAVLPVNLEIPIANLQFLPRNGTQAGSLSIFVSTRDAAGNPSRVQKIPFHLAIPDDKMEQASADSAHYPLPLVLRPGDQQVAIGIRDDVAGNFSAIRLDVSEHSRF